MVTTKAIPATILAAALATIAGAQTAAPPTRVGVIHIQNAIIGTKDGQKAAAELETKLAPKRKELEGKQSAIAQLQDQLNKGRNTMAADQREKLIRDIDQRTKSLNRDTEDAQAEVEQEQQKILQELGQRIMAVIDKYARDNGFNLILDVSSPQTPVLYISSGIDITQEIVALYDKNAPAGAAPAAPAARPPVAPAPKKK
ncbi:MAG: OmpH family outer membrane protein [Acidobacteria bacterium]|nr:OmpH family outer membrane protein [Acidobacteriota bacterium]